MEIKMEKQDWVFFLLCLIVGVLAEESFFRAQIGFSYFVFIVAFYALFFWRFRSFSFSHQRFGYLVLICIWLLAAGYYLYDTTLFYGLNILIIPALVIFHLALITSAKKPWNNLLFLLSTLRRLGKGIVYSAFFTKYLAVRFAKSKKHKNHEIWKKVLLGILIAIPFLVVILNLLISADAQFARILSLLPDLLDLRVDYLFRLIISLIYTFGFFGFLQVLKQKNPLELGKGIDIKSISLDGIITLTVLLLIDLVYVMFVAVQFKYFFNGTLETGFTYAEYARRGFFELLFVTLINLTVITVVVQCTKNILGALKKVISIALTILVLSSGVILTSAYMRMMMYEEAYGYTFTRVLAHSFMIFLMVILAYTLVKIWLEKLSLFHFYFIASLLYYTGINVINLDKAVVDLNIARYEETKKIDIHYLNILSSEGLLGLIELYERDPNIPGLKELLKQRVEERSFMKNESWQSYNYTRDRAYKQLGDLGL